jgi:hypothetical protein
MMKLKSGTIYLLLFLLVSIGTRASRNCKDTIYDLNIESIEIISYNFDRRPRFSMDFSSLLSLRERHVGDKDVFYDILNQMEALELEKKLSPHLKADTLDGISDNDMDIRFLMIIHYKNSPPVFIGIEASPSGRMFVNEKRHRRDKNLLLYALPYISNTDVKKSILREMKHW